MIDKDRLLKPRLAESDYEIPDVGTVRVRVLSWEECSGLQAWTEAKGKTAAVAYRRILSLALVDPVLTEEEAGELMAAATGGEIEDLVRHIVVASGLTEGAQKSP